MLKDSNDFFVVVIIISHIGDWRHGFCFHIHLLPRSINKLNQADLLAVANLYAAVTLAAGPI